jgi:hypothetical protein
MRLIVLLFSILYATTISAEGQDLSQYQWTNRVVLLFGEPSHPIIRRQLAEFNKDRAGMHERDLKVLLITKEEVKDLFSDKMLPFSAHELRDKYGNLYKVFQYVLIGKDGSRKLNQYNFVPKKELFATIDAMPMRRQEIKTKKKETGRK